MSQKEINKENNNHFELIRKMLEDIQYGNIVIMVQDGKVVQVDKTEKYRIRN